VIDTVEDDVIFSTRSLDPGCGQFGARMRSMPTQDHEALHAASRSAAVGAAIAALRVRGERVTAPRQAVLQVFAAHPAPLSAEDVAAALDGGDVHRATVYRTLDLLVAAGVVTHARAAGGAARYHLTVTGTTHEHLHGHCRECGTVVPLPVDALDATAVRLRETTGFSLDARQSSLAGRCRACRAGSVGE
jgi:Fur family transcriptional regulator, ferric uptake regulator